ncbi:hypothetical protein PQH01_03545 [Bacteroides cellulosilyticus]|uniref:hypothetical protein n=1 Tax=Bacteroides cellulosilyticus TaxID=246787 RepID=UPI00234CD8FD|nr:hypothetical protein [Bacteroides cellulosilyticus]MDC7175113.1 hypothetical protein [Bacteroides cellulosilyticus]MDC7181287.1 hypothetical protein [Bacteroides cellulosilyticus]
MRKKICIVGQGEGGNAKLWFDFLSEHKEFIDTKCILSFVCKNQRQFPANFKVFSPYGKKKTILPTFLMKIYKSLFFKCLMSVYYFFLFRSIRPDYIIIQGNYSPLYNKKIVDRFNGDFVINIYGSDFYQLYYGGSDRYKGDFKAILQRAKYVTCNWFTTRDDLQKEFPEISDKIVCIPWGVNSFWQLSPSSSKKKKEITFLSTRGLYTYNNVDKLVEAFCIVCGGKTKFKLNIINGYGNHPDVIQKIKDIINKYHCQNQISLICNQWISDDKLKEYYVDADYNFCIGDTDQLTVSIIYGYLTRTQNILSSLDAYKRLDNFGFKSQLILNDVTLPTLVSFFERVIAGQNIIDDECTLNDYNVACKMNMCTTFEKYLELLWKI